MAKFNSPFMFHKSRIGTLWLHTFFYTYCCVYWTSVAYTVTWHLFVLLLLLLHLHKYILLFDVKPQSRAKNRTHLLPNPNSRLTKQKNNLSPNQKHEYQSVSWGSGWRGTQAVITICGMTNMTVLACFCGWVATVRSVPQRERCWWSSVQRRQQMIHEEDDNVSVYVTKLFCTASHSRLHKNRSHWPQCAGRKHTFLIIGSEHGLSKDLTSGPFGSMTAVPAERTHWSEASSHWRWDRWWQEHIIEAGSEEMVVINTPANPRVYLLWLLLLL